tara:strand:+ start:7791 stop:8246 length:456 start_codon:yes stop_codon:yes gene_type:complete
MTVEIKVRDEGDKIIADVTLPRYGGSTGQTPVDCRVTVQYVQKNLESLGYSLEEGEGPMLRNRYGDESGTYVFKKVAPPKAAPRSPDEPIAHVKIVKKEFKEVIKKTEEIKEKVVEKEIQEVKKEEEKVVKQPTPLPSKNTPRTMKRRTES